MTRSDEQEFDVIVLGAGSAGETVAGELSRAGRRVAVVERGLVGGECPYYACIPSKTMLLAARAFRRSGRPTDRGNAWQQAVAHRDESARHLDDAKHVSAMEKDGVSVIRGTGRAAGPSAVAVDAGGGGMRLVWREALVVATGSEASIPPIDGLADVPTWTSDDALSSAELPARLAILGGGPVGCELAQVYAGFGCEVTLLEAAPGLLPREPEWAGETLAEALRQTGVRVHTGTAVAAASSSPQDPVVLRTEDGDRFAADRLLVAIGKKPRTADLGLQALGVEPGDHGELPVDGRCRVLAKGAPVDGVFAVGDVTGIAPYTHAANYQGRIVAAHLLGRGRDADYTGVPRVVYTDPPVLSAGETADGARERGVDVVSAQFDVIDTARAFVERLADPGDERPGRLEIIADAESGVLLGAAAVAPEADSWAGELALAVRTRTTLDVLADHVHAFPSWGEAIHVPARELADRIRSLRDER